MYRPVYYETEKTERKLKQIDIFAAAEISFAFNLNDLSKLQEIIDLLRKEINSYINIEINSKREIKTLDFEK